MGCPPVFLTNYLFKKLKNKKASSHEEGFLGLLILHSHSAYFTKHIVHSNNEG